MLPKLAASLLIIGTTASPSFTGNVPPVTKQFCTSTTISALFASGVSFAAAKLPPVAATRPVLARAFNKVRRAGVCMVKLLGWMDGTKRNDNDIDREAGGRRRACQTLR